LIGRVAVAEFLCLWDPTTAGRRVDIAAEVARMARASGDTDLGFYAGFFAAITAAERRDLTEARRRLDTLAEPLAAAHNPYFGFLAERLSVSIDILTGRPEVQELIDALAERYAGTYADTTGTWSLQTGALALQRGEFGGLAPVVQTMVDESETGANWKPPLGLALLEAGDRDAAMAVLDDLGDYPLDYFWLTTMQVVADLAVSLGRRDVAARVYEALLPFRDQLGITASGSLCLGLVATTLGRLALALDDDARAVELLRDAVACSDAMDAPFERVRSRRLLAAALVAASAGTDDAEPVLAEAAAIAATHGFAGEQRLIAAAKS
jgi:hypothetical protein